MPLSYAELMGMGNDNGQADLEPPAPGFPGKYVQTTKPGTTVVSKVRRAPVKRRVDVTRQLQELEFLVGTPGIPARVLAQKAWTIRRALMGSRVWPWASYGVPGQQYSSHDELQSRLEGIEKILGIDKISPKVMSALYGMGGLGSAISTPRWGRRFDPITKLASCINARWCGIMSATQDAVARAGAGAKCEVHVHCGCPCECPGRKKRNGKPPPPNGKPPPKKPRRPPPWIQQPPPFRRREPPPFMRREPPPFMLQPPPAFHPEPPPPAFHPELPPPGFMTEEPPGFIPGTIPLFKPELPPPSFMVEEPPPYLQPEEPPGFIPGTVPLFKPSFAIEEPPLVPMPEQPPPPKDTIPLLKPSFAIEEPPLVSNGGPGNGLVMAEAYLAPPVPPPVVQTTVSPTITTTKEIVQLAPVIKVETPQAMIQALPQAKPAKAPTAAPVVQKFQQLVTSLPQAAKAVTAPTLAPIKTTVSDPQAFQKLATSLPQAITTTTQVTQQAKPATQVTQAVQAAPVSSPASAAAAASLVGMGLGMLGDMLSPEQIVAEEVVAKGIRGPHGMNGLGARHAASQGIVQRALVRRLPVRGGFRPPAVLRAPPGRVSHIQALQLRLRRCQADLRACRNRR